MRKRWIILVVCSVFLGVLAGYAFKTLKQDKPKIAVVLKGSKSQYWQIMIAGVEKGFDNFGAEGTFFAPDMKGENQLDILKKVLKQKPDALIFSPTDPAMSVSILKEYKKNNIPVLIVDTGVEWPDQTSFIGTDNPTLGKQAGEWLSSMLQPGDKVALIGREASDSVSIDRLRGSKEALQAAGIDSVEAKVPFGRDESTVRAIMSKIIKNHPDIKGVHASDDGLALEVLKFLDEKGLKMPVIGADGIIQMVKYIETGTLTGTVAQNPYDMGYISVENALKAIKGEKVQKQIDSGVDIITTDNAKEKLEFLKEVLKQG